MKFKLLVITFLMGQEKAKKAEEVLHRSAEASNNLVSYIWVFGEKTTTHIKA